MARIICAVTNDLNYDQRMIRICTTLIGAGHSVLLIGRKKKQSTPLSQRAFRQMRMQLFFKKGKLFYLEYNLRLFAFLIFKKTDILYAVDLDTLSAMASVAAIRRKKIVFDAHEYFTELPEVVERPIVQKIWAWVAKIFIPRVDAAITVGQSLAGIFTDKYRIPFAVIRNVPFKNIQDKNIRKAQPPVLLYQGVLNEGRGLEAAILAMHKLEDCQLWLAGEGDKSEELRQLAHREKLSEKVRFTGYLLPEGLQRITAQATIGLNLLENKGLNYYYSLANKAFDYIQSAIPSIQMDFPEYRLLHEEFGVFHLIQNTQPQGIAHAIRQLLDHQDRYRRQVKNCRMAAEKLNWEVEEEQLLRIFRRLTAENQNRIS